MKVLVPLDGSTFAETVVPTAVALAAASSKPEVILFRAAEATFRPGQDAVEAQLDALREAEDYLDLLAARLRRGAANAVRTSVWYGPAAGSIAEASDSCGADVIAMTTHGRGGLGRFFVGSVAESVVRAAAVPVVLLRPSLRHIDRGPDPVPSDVPEPRAFTRVLVPLDGSPDAERLIPFVADVAKALDLDVRLLRVLSPFASDTADGAPEAIVDDVAQREEEARESLVPIAARFRSAGVRVQVHVRRGDPITGILAAAKTASADLIAMTTHGRSGLGRMLFGSVAEAVVRHSEMPVLLVRATDRRHPARAMPTEAPEPLTTRLRRTV